MHRVGYQRGIVHNGRVMHRIRHQRGVVHFHYGSVMHHPRGKPARALHAAQAVHPVGAAAGDVEQRYRVAVPVQRILRMQPHADHAAAVPCEGAVLHREHQHTQRGVVLPRRADDMAAGSLAEGDVLRLQPEVAVRVLHVQLQGGDLRVVVKHDAHLRHGGRSLGVALQVEGVGLVALGRQADALQLVARVVGVEQQLGAMAALGGAAVDDVQRVAPAVGDGQGKAVLQLPAVLGEHHAVHHQRRIAGVAQRQGGCRRLGDRRIAQVHAAVAAQVGTVDAHRAGIDGREHVASRAVAQGGLTQLQRVASVAVQPHPEARHHAVGAMQRVVAQAGDQQGQRVALQARRGHVVVGARGVDGEAAHLIGEGCRQHQAGLQAHDAVHVVHPQFHGHHAVGVAAHVQRPQLVHGVGIGGDGHHAVTHRGIGAEDRRHRRGAGRHGTVGEGDATAAASGKGRRGGRSCYVCVVNDDATQRQRLVAGVPHRHAARIAAAYRHVAVVQCRRRHLHLRGQHGHRAGRGTGRDRCAVGGREHRRRYPQRVVAGLASQHHTEREHLATVAREGIQCQRVAVQAQRVAQHRSCQLVAVAAAAVQHRTARHVGHLVAHGNKGLQGRHGSVVGHAETHGHRVARMPAAARQREAHITVAAPGPIAEGALGQEG